MSCAAVVVLGDRRAGKDRAYSRRNISPLMLRACFLQECLTGIHRNQRGQQIPRSPDRPRKGSELMYKVLHPQLREKQGGFGDLLCKKAAAHMDTIY
jgi:hypothetical protein